MAKLLRTIESNGHGLFGTTEDNTKVPLGIPSSRIFSYYPGPSSGRVPSPGTSPNFERVLSTLLIVSRGYLYFNPDEARQVDGRYIQPYILFSEREAKKPR